MAKITKIEAQKRKNRVNLYIDNQYVFSVSKDLLVDFNIFKDKDISKEETEKIKNRDNELKVLSVAYRLLSYRPRSEKEMRERLIQKYNPDLVNKTIKNLKKENLINDNDFVTFWIKSRSRTKGKSLLRLELMEKGISREVAEQKLGAVGGDNDYKNAIRLILSKKRFKDLAKNNDYQKIRGYLLRRGFSSEIVKKVLEKLH